MDPKKIQTLKYDKKNELCLSLILLYSVKYLFEL